MIPRQLKNLLKTRTGQGKAFMIIGPRQAGKTTLLKHLYTNKPDTLWFLGDNPDTRELFSNITSTKLKTILGSCNLLIIDEAQRIENIGVTVKMVIDAHPDVQVIVTGSSSLELANTINEPLTGRKFEFNLFPVSYGEMVDYIGAVEERRLLEHRLIFGYYPDIITHNGQEQELLETLSSSYLYKDLLAYQQIRKPVVLEKLVQALALQLGNEVVYRELAEVLSTDPVTVERYIDLLEKSCVIFRLHSLSRNMRNEIKKGRKIYFYDLGIRNAIIKNFNPLGMRDDTGALWENFCILERMKTLHYQRFFINRYFWRTHAQQEVDYIEEYGGNLNAYEFKWNPRKKKSFPKSFLKAYPGSATHIISQDNFESFVLNEGKDCES